MILGGLGEGAGPEPRSSPLLTYARKGRPRHLMLDKYFLALLPAFSSNSLGVIHSSPARIHFPLEPDSYLLTKSWAETDLQRTVITGPSWRPWWWAWLDLVEWWPEVTSPASGFWPVVTPVLVWLGAGEYTDPGLAVVAGPRGVWPRLSAGLAGCPAAAPAAAAWLLGVEGGAGEVRLARLLEVVTVPAARDEASGLWLRD